MRKLLLSLSVLVLASCTTSTWVQVCTVSPVKGESVKLSTEECDVNYKMNENQGSLDLYVRNNTDKVITVDLAQSFACINDTATDYFANTQISNTLTVSQSVGQNLFWGYADKHASTNSTISYADKQFLSVPPRAVRVIRGPHITSGPIPTGGTCPKDKSQTYRYSYDKSPVRITTGVTYTINGVSKYISNDLYVSEITDYSFDYRTDENRSTGVYTVKKKKSTPTPVINVPVFVGSPYSYFIIY